MDEGRDTIRFAYRGAILRARLRRSMDRFEKSDVTHRVDHERRGRLRARFTRPIRGPLSSRPHRDRRPEGKSRDLHPKTSRSGPMENLGTGDPDEPPAGPSRRRSRVHIGLLPLRLPRRSRLRASPDNSRPGTRAWRAPSPRLGGTPVASRIARPGLGRSPSDLRGPRHTPRLLSDHRCAEAETVGNRSGEGDHVALVEHRFAIDQAAAVDSRRDVTTVAQHQEDVGRW